MPYPTKPKGGWQQPRQVVVNKSTAQIHEKKATRKFMNKYQEIIQSSMAQGPSDPTGSISVSRRRKDVRFSSRRDVAEYPEKPSFRQSEKRLPSGGHRNTKNYYGEESSGTYADTPGVFTESSGWSNASDGQPSDNETTGGEERPDQISNDGIQGHRASASTHYATGTKTQVSHVALQTDTCDTLYVTKNTLTAYTIAIVQNSQTLQYDQMHVALQTVRNQSSLETPLRGGRTFECTL